MARRPIEVSMENLHRQMYDRVIREAYGYIIPTETILAWKKDEKSKRAPAEYTVEQLRGQWIEAMTQQGVGRFERMAHPGKTTAEIAHERAQRPRAPGKYYPVSRAEVEAAREAALQSGVTLSTYTEWFMLLRNYEADPTVLQMGPLRQVRRGPLPSTKLALVMTRKKPGTTLTNLAEHIDNLGDCLTDQQKGIREQIKSILADLNRPLRPRRTKLRVVRDRNAG